MAKISLNQVKRSFLKSRLEKVEHKISMTKNYLPIYMEDLKAKHSLKLTYLSEKHASIYEKLHAKSLTGEDKVAYLSRKASEKFDKNHYWNIRAIHQKLNLVTQKGSKEEIDAAKKNHEQSLDELNAKKTLFVEKVKASAKTSTTTINPNDVVAKKAELDAIYQAKVQLFTNQEKEVEEKLSARATEKIEKLSKLQKTLSDEIQAILVEDKKILSKKLENLMSIEKDIVDQNKKLEVSHQISHLNKKLEMEDLKSDVHLSISHLTMSFAGLKAVDDLSFSVKKGSIFGLIGPNGAGKTTVFNCITQFYKPTSGQVYYHSPKGDVISLLDYKVHDVIKQGIVRTFQNVELIWELSILDNMLVGAHTQFKTGFFTHLLHLKSLKREEDVMRAKALKVLASLDLLLYKDFYPIGLPYGILKKIELARTLMSNPKLIILDEPAAGLNDMETKSLANTIKQIRDEYQCTIFLVEHDMELVMDICDEICAISFGKKLAIGTPKEIQNNPLVQEAYLGGE